MTFRQNVFSFLVLAFVISGIAWGQSNYAGLSGSVVDPQQRAIVGTRVHLSSAGTGAEREVTTNSDGIFLITGVAPGEYDLSVNAEGFAPLSRHVRLEVGQQMSANFELKVASVADSVNVSAGDTDVL